MIFALLSLISSIIFAECVGVTFLTKHLDIVLTPCVRLRWLWLSPLSDSDQCDWCPRVSWALSSVHCQTTGHCTVVHCCTIQSPTTLHSSVQWPASVSVCNIRPQPPNLLEINHQELLPICYAPNTENASSQFQVTLTFIQSHHSQFGDHTFTPDIRQARGFDFDINFMIS